MLLSFEIISIIILSLFNILCLKFLVMFLYPEYTETDFIEEFIEDQVFEDHLVIFNIHLKFVKKKF